MEAQVPSFANDILTDEAVLQGLEQAWLDSQPGMGNGHEEGGFIVEDGNGSQCVVRWPTGDQDGILMPPHAHCRIDGKKILATFHTHPNTGDHYRQEPGRVDIRAVSSDPDLKEDFYVGEFVVSHHSVYLIMPDGEVLNIGRREATLLQIEES